MPGSNSWWAPVLLSVLLAFVAVMFLSATVPAADVRARDAWPASLLVAVALVALQNLFALYVANFAHYDDVYGSLGAIVAFMFFVYLAAQVFLLGAELTSEWPVAGNESRGAEHARLRRSR